MKTILANGHTVVNLGLSTLLNKYFSKMQIAIVCSYNDLLNDIKTSTFDLIIFDINMHDCKSFQKIAVIKNWCPHSRIIIFSDNAPDSYEFHCLKAGASAFISKNADEETIRYIIEQVLTRGKYFSPNLITASLTMEDAFIPEPENSGKRELSTREMDVCNLLVQGNGVLEIANTLGLSYSAVSTYKKRIFEKLKLSNIAQLIALWNSKLR